MKSSSSLRTAIFAATIAMLGVSAQAGSMPTQMATMNSMIHQNTIEVRSGGSWRGGGYDYRCVGSRGDRRACPVYRYPSVSYYDGIFRNSHGCSGSYCSRPLTATTNNDRLPWTD